jgi:hypothetical protein
MTHPIQRIIEIAGGYALPRCLHVVADLGVADHIADIPRPAAELAAEVGADADALGRVMQLLSAHGVFESHPAGFAHSEVSRFLRTDHPASMRAFARMFGLPVNWQGYGGLSHTVATGRPATETMIEGGYWAYFAKHPEASAIFNAAMVGKAQGEIGAILATYDFASAKRIADIGGGKGQLLAAILGASPASEGVLFDLPHVVEESRALASDRLSLASGDFFRDALPSGDLFLLMDILHDWPDAECEAILGAVRRAAPSGAKLLVIELVVPDDPGPAWAKTLDIHMLTLLGGRQRRTSEYVALFERTGFALNRQLLSPAGTSILEAVPT